MKRGGIFTGLGDLGGQTLALRTLNASGQTTSNPFAAAVQTVLRQKHGADNLTVDGKWSDCSQQAYINAFGAKPNPSDLYDIMQVYHFGEPTLKAWDKTPTCPSPEGEVTGASNFKIQPALILAKMLNLPVPDGICAKLHDGEGHLLHAGMAPNLETGTCERKVSSTLRYSMTVSKPSLPVFQKAPGGTIQSKLTQVQSIPNSIYDVFKSIISIPTASALPGAQIPSQYPSNSQSSPAGPGVASTGMSAGAKLAVAAVAVAAIAGGVVLWKRSKSAVPNCGFYPNCGE